MVSLSNLKSYLSNPSQIFNTEAMEVMLRLIKRVYLFDSLGSFRDDRHCTLTACIFATRKFEIRLQNHFTS